MERFPHIPPEAVLKEDLLRTGIAFDDSALTDNLDGEVKPKSYFIFSFDQKPLAAARRGGDAPPAGGDRADRRPVRRCAARSSRCASTPTRRTASRATRTGRCSCRSTAARSPTSALPPMPEYYRHDARERQDRDGDGADDPVGLPDLPDRAAPLPVLRRQGGVPVLRHQPQLAPAQAGGPPVHRRQAGRGRARGARAHRPLRHREGLARRTR